ncbi:hypothetical protein J7E79_03720 [Bacillus sp. ISL-40]|uniref:lipase/acyltransferase domain-containing protein n=1 Tax=Bacillus sp. ISL-40 TaxID=2819126 RepID=UPI001BE6B01D|nr:hypothetical protein [Bacillus sp. ISL-40]MBT2696535.1 hypothetical protein [Bacillus sp. ISL-40]
MILFVPGIKGSVLFEGDNKRWFPATLKDLESLEIKNTLEAKEILSHVTPFGATKYSQVIYKGLLDEFGDEIILHPYDWRRSLYDHVDTLAKRIVSLSNHEKLTIVAHSMGGLLTKLALLRLEETGENINININKFITIGTPWKGSPDSYKALVYGEPGIYEELSDFFQILNVENTRKIARQYPSVYQLLPSEDYFLCQDGDFIIPNGNIRVTYNDVKQKVQILHDLENKKEGDDSFTDVWREYIDPIHLDMKKPLPDGIEHICLVGYSHPTLYKIPEKSKVGLGIKKYKKQSTFMNGDGVVPLESAKPYNISSIFYVKGEHKNLCSVSNVLEFIRECSKEVPITEIDLPTGIINEEHTDAPLNHKLKAGFLAKIMCPVESTILDSEGKYIAGVFDTSITEVSDLALNSAFKYFSVGEAKYLYFDKEIDSDLSFEISSYDEGIASVSLEDFEHENIEYKFETIPVNKKKSATLIIPLDKEIKDSVLKVDDEELIPTIKEKVTDEQSNAVVIPNISIKINYEDAVSKVYRKHTYSGPIKFEVKSTDPDNIEELFYSIDKSEVHSYKEEVLLDLPSGEHFLEVFGRDKLNRDIESKELKFYIEKNPPQTNLDITAGPNGIFVKFFTNSPHAPVETHYRFIQDEQDPEELEWNIIDTFIPIKLPSNRILEKRDEKVRIEFFSKYRDLPFSENKNIFDFSLGNVPEMMWEDKTTYLTPKMIFDNIVKNSLLTIDDFIIKRSIQNKYSDITPDTKIGDNVKSIRFESKRLSFEVLFSEKYSLYFSGPPTELLEVGQVYKFSFVLRTERSNINITSTDPVAKLHPVKARHLGNKVITLAVKEEGDGTFFGEFEVDDNFKEYKHKLIITDSKNVSPPLREIPLTLSEE